MNLTSRPLIQDLVKEALNKDAQRANIAAEGARQMKLASGETSKEASSREVASSADDQIISTDFAMKLASACEYAMPEFMKMAAIHLTGGTHDPAAPPEGVSSSQQNQTQIFTPSGQGKGHAQPPQSPGTQASNHGAATQMDNNMNHPPGGSGTQTTALTGGKGKVAEAEKCKGCGKEKDACTCSKTASTRTSSPALQSRLAKLAGVKAAEFPPKKDDGEEKKEEGDKKPPPFAKKDDEKKEASQTLVGHFLSQTKVAEDAINPAKISAGAAVPPDTSAAGESGGEPAGGKPQGPTSLVGSNESAAHYKKNEAYAPRKAELKQYFNEPALTSSTDDTLQKAFTHTGEAGVKISSPQGPQVKTAAARALLMKLAENTAGKAKAV